MAPKKGNGFVLVLALLIVGSLMVFAEASDNSQPNQLPFISYDYLEMSLQWPPSVCSNLKVECALSYEKRFIIRSFKPMSYFIRPWCIGPKFNITKIEHIRPQLSKVWYDLVYGKDENVWKEAWEKHGICSASEFDQADYFELALNIKNNRDYSVLDIVQSVGITPKESNPLWKRDRYYNAIFWRTGKKPILRCNTNKYTKKSQLFEVSMCFAKDGIQQIDCPNHGDCPEYFTWPTTANPPPPPSPPPANFIAINNQ